MAEFLRVDFLNVLLLLNDKLYKGKMLVNINLHPLQSDRLAFLGFLNDCKNCELAFAM